MIIKAVVRFNQFIERIKRKNVNSGAVLTLLIVMPGILAVSFPFEYWYVIIAGVLYLLFLFLIRFAWVVMSEDLIGYVEERSKGAPNEEAERV